ncbi:TPA: DNA-binding protein [Yersinia enterocolitica]|nr:DNA-binding protein [Yersinia enterocolitica]
MKKVSIIAQCLINDKCFSEMSEAESSIKKVFNDSYADDSFDEWNTDVSPLSANRVICKVASATKVRVRGLIQELWNH